MTHAQKWAKTRNFLKFRLRGTLAFISNALHYSVQTEEEIQLLQDAGSILKKLLYQWDSSNKESKEAYLAKVR